MSAKRVPTTRYLFSHIPPVNIKLILPKMFENNFRFRLPQNSAENRYILNNIDFYRSIHMLFVVQLVLIQLVFGYIDLMMIIDMSMMYPAHLIEEQYSHVFHLIGERFSPQGSILN